MDSGYDVDGMYICVNQSDVTDIMADVSLTYTEYAKGGNDMLSVQMEDVDSQWLEGWYPEKGSEVSAGLRFVSSGYAPAIKYPFGKFCVDEVRVSGYPTTLCVECVSSVSKGAFAITPRFQSWEKASIEQIAQEICNRHSMTLSYSADEIIVGMAEQSEPDSAFLFGLCESYGLSMKAYGAKLVIYSQTVRESQDAPTEIFASDFLDGDWECTDSTYGTYTGARVSYKNPATGVETNLYAGLCDEPDARVLRVTEAVSGKADAWRRAAAAVNRSQEKAVTLVGTIAINPSVFAGGLVNIADIGSFLDGKYFIDKSTIEYGEETVQKIEAHKCQDRIT